MVPEAPLDKTANRGRARWPWLVRPQRDRGALARAAAARLLAPLRGDGRLCAARRHALRARARRADRDVPLGGGPGGLPRPRRRRAAARRGAGAAAQAVGLRPLPAGDEAHHRRRRRRAVRRARTRSTREPGRAGLGGLHRRRTSPCGTAPESMRRRTTPRWRTRASRSRGRCPTAPGCRRSTRGYRSRPGRPSSRRRSSSSPISCPSCALWRIAASGSTT